MTTIKLKNGSGAPTAGDLVQGEPALDLTNKRLYTEDSVGTVIEVGTNPTSITTGTITGSGDMAIDTNTLFVDVSANSVGIGTTSPSAELDIVGDATDAQIEVGNNLGQKLTITGGSSGIDFTTANALAMTFGTSGSERLRIDSSGEIGIGNAVASTINASSGIGNLVVGSGSDNEGITIYTGSSSYGALNFADATSGAGAYAGYIKFDHSDNSFGHFIDNVERVRIDSSGNVGISTTSPSSFNQVGADTLVVGSGSGEQGITIYSGTANNGVLAFADGTTTTQQYQGYIGYNHASNFMRFFTGATEKMRIDSSGNVGIGTSSPSSVLTVAVDDATGDNGARIAGVTDGNKQLRLAYNTTGNYANIQAIHAGTAYTNLVLQKDGGNVGIGTSSPSFGLSVESDNGSGYAALFRKSSSDPALTIQTTSSITQIQGLNSALSATNDIAMQVSGGNVGIGTASPANLMHLEGTGVVVGATQLTLEGRYNGYGAGLEFVSRTSSGGTRATMAKITADGEAAWNTTASTQDAGLRFSTTEGGTLSEKVRISASGNVGIGTNNPTARLEIAYSGGSQIEASNGSGTFRILNDGTNSNLLSNGPMFYQTNATGEHIFQQSGGSSEAMRIDGSGNVGIGTTNAPYKLVVSNGGASSIEIEPAYSGTANLVQHYNRSGAAYVDAVNIAGQHRFAIGGSEAMRIDSSGNLLVGCTAKPSASVVGTMISDDLDTEGNKTSTSLTTTATHFVFFNPNGAVGSISTSGSATAYNTSSDQRLKDNIVDAPSASDDIDAIQVRSFDWKADGSHQKYGMVAQELQTVAPEAVTEGETEEDMMSVDYSKLVPMLVKEIQSLRARVAQLEGAN